MEKTWRRFVIVFGTLFSISVPLLIAGLLLHNDLACTVGGVGVMAGLCWIGYSVFLYLYLTWGRTERD